MSISRLSNLLEKLKDPKNIVFKNKKLIGSGTWNKVYSVEIGNVSATYVNALDVGTQEGKEEKKEDSKKSFIIAKREGISAESVNFTQQTREKVKELKSPFIHHPMHYHSTVGELSELSPIGNLPDYLSVEYGKGTINYKEIIAQVLLALEYLHENNLVNLDVKFENFLVFNIGGNIRIKLADNDALIRINLDGTLKEGENFYVPSSPFPELKTLPLEKINLKLVNCYQLGTSLKNHFISGPLGTLADLLSVKDPEHRYTIANAKDYPFFGNNHEECAAFFKKLKEAAEQADQNANLFLDDYYIDPHSKDIFPFLPLPIKNIYLSGSKVADNSKRILSLIMTLQSISDLDQRKLLSDQEGLALIFTSCIQNLNNTLQTIDQSLKETALKKFHSILIEIRNELKLIAKSTLFIMLKENTATKSMELSIELKRQFIEALRASIDSCLKEKESKNPFSFSYKTDRVKLAALNSLLSEPRIVEENSIEKCFNEINTFMNEAGSSWKKSFSTKLLKAFRAYPLLSPLDYDSLEDIMNRFSTSIQFKI